VGVVEDVEVSSFKQRGGSAGAEQRAPSAKRVVDIDNAITTDQVRAALQSMPGTLLKLLQQLQSADHAPLLGEWIVVQMKSGRQGPSDGREDNAAPEQSPGSTDITIRSSPAPRHLRQLSALASRALSG